MTLIVYAGSPFELLVRARYLDVWCAVQEPDMAKKKKKSTSSAPLVIGLIVGGVLLLCACAGGVTALVVSGGNPAGLAGLGAPFAGSWEYRVGTHRDDYEFGPAGRGRLQEFDERQSKTVPIMTA